MAFRGSLFAFAVLYLSQHAAAQNFKAPSIITMNGFGTAAAKSDRVTISGAVSVTKQSVSAATKALSKYTAAVHNGLLAVDGITAENISTTNVMIHNEYAYHKNGDSGPVTYRVQQSLDIELNQVSGEFIAKVIDAMVAGAGDYLQLHNIEFGLTDSARQELLSEARKEAVADASHKAQLYTQALGVGLGDILEVSEGGSSTGRPMAMSMMARSAKGAVAEMAAESNFEGPVGVGEASVTASVTISWEITQQGSTTAQLTKSQHMPSLRATDVASDDGIESRKKPSQAEKETEQQDGEKKELKEGTGEGNRGEKDGEGKDKLEKGENDKAGKVEKAESSVADDVTQHVKRDVITDVGSGHRHNEGAHFPKKHKYEFLKAQKAKKKQQQMSA